MCLSLYLSIYPTSYPSHWPSIVSMVSSVLEKGWWSCLYVHTQMSSSQNTTTKCTVCHQHYHAWCVHMSNDCIWLIGLMPISLCLHCPSNVLSWSQQLLSLFVGEDGSFHFIAVSSFFNLKVQIVLSQWEFSLQKMFPYSNVNHYCWDFETCHFNRNYLWSLCLTDTSMKMVSQDS